MDMGVCWCGQCDRLELDATKCDVFSFAVLALYVATGARPHSGLTNEGIFVKVPIVVCLHVPRCIRTSTAHV